MSASRALVSYRVIFSALLIVASLQTLGGAHAQHPVLVLAGCEIAGALLLCWRRTQSAGAGVLLIVFACAQWLSARQGELPTRFAQFAASALLIVIMDRALARARLMAAAPSVEQH